MKIVGLAGRPGSGKSAVARRLAKEAGFAWIDLDRVAWETYAPGAESYAPVIERFGRDVVAGDGSIDRPKLAVRVFLEAGAREDLEAIVHPAVCSRLRSIADAHRQRGTRTLLVEGALLTTSPHVDRGLFDAILWFDAPDAVREGRLRVAGRVDHVTRGEDVAPGERSIRVDADGTIDEVVQRVRAAIDAL
jgi:dephospho-CoA kinase